MKKRIISILLCTVMLIAVLGGCSNSNNGNSGSDSTTANTAGGGSENGGDDTGSDGNSKYDKFITIDVFSTLANYQGTQSGWFAEVVKEKFNMELNIIAPNIAGGGDTLYQTRVASGNLADLIIMGADNGKLQEVVTSGVILDVSNMLSTRENLSNYLEAIEYINHGNEATAVTEAGLYAMPAEVSSADPTAATGTRPTYGPYLRWDLYKELGYPKMETLEDMLDVLEEMMALEPTTENGSKVYGISLFPDWDGNMLNNAKQPTCFYGYDELGFVLATADGTASNPDFQSIIDSDSEYVRVLKWFFEANQRGLLDPESSTQNYDTLYAKYEEGAVLFSFWPWVGQSAYNTTENLEAGKGFMMADIEDMKIFGYGGEPFGSKTFLGVGANCEDPDRVLDFIDWLYSPEGIMYNGSQTQSMCGPQDLTWEMVDGEPVLTEFGISALVDGDAVMPDEWGGGKYTDGISQLNVSPVKATDLNPATGFAYDFTTWPSYQRMTNDPVTEDWREVMGALNAQEYLVQNNKTTIAAGAGYVAPEESSELQILRTQVKSIIVDYSWKMVYADSEATFNSLLTELQEKANGLGYDQLLEFDMKNAQDQADARQSVVDIYGTN